MKLRKLVALSLLTSLALIMFIIELRLPNLCPVAGVKLGLANIITVYCIYHFSAFETGLLVLSRVILGSLFSGNMYSL
ncbi:MAG: Gx transporter family protein, partial [Ruminococcus sp.]